MKSGAKTPLVPDIVQEILGLWWQGSEQGSRFQSISQAFRAVAGTCGNNMLTEILTQAGAGQRARATEALGQMGAAAATEPVLRWLTDCLDDPNNYVRDIAAEATVAELSGEPEL
jgi:hypothetical protein